MKFSIEQKIFENYPSTHVGLIFVTACNNQISSPEISFVLKESETVLKEKMVETPLLELPEMKKWRETYKTFGAKKGRRVSIEAMAKRVNKGESLPSISPLVDLYNAVSLRYMFPCGGEDLDKVSGDVKLTISDGTESFLRIGGEENEPPSVGEVVYKDDLGCLCRCWNWREADRTKLTDQTRNAVLVVETLSPEREKEFISALKHLSDLVGTLTGAQTDMYVLNKNTPHVEYEV